MDPIRIAYVRYLNTAPLVEGLQRLEGLEMIPAAPSRIAGLVASGAADVGLASVIDAAGSDLTLLPVGMIASEGATLTVRLFSPVPPQDVTRVLADSESHTSVALCRVLLNERFGIRPRFIEFDAASPSSQRDSQDAMLLIGDKVVTGAPSREQYPHSFDLGACWRELTGLPFVYAVWMCRRDDAGSPRIVTAAAILDRQRRRNQMRASWIATTRAGGRGWPEALAREYLTDLIRYDVDEPAREAVGAFLAKCEALGLVPSANVAWADDEIGASR